MKKQNFIVAALKAGFVIPFLYYGIQIIAALFYPGYNFITMIASDLGSTSAPYPLIFNIGIIVLGACAILAAVGVLLVLKSLGVNMIVAWLTGLSVFCFGVGTLLAGIFPLPNPLHNNPFSIAGIILPFLFAIAMWKLSISTATKIYFVAASLLSIVFIPVLMGAFPVNVENYAGILQRISSLFSFPSIAVATYLLMQRIEKKIEP